MLNGKVVIISAPSGAGKSTIVNFLLKVFTNLSFSVSVTTRKIRTDEKEGRDYYFISKEEFKKLILENKFVEWEEVYDGDFKGTLKSEVESIISKKKHIIFPHRHNKRQSTNIEITTEVIIILNGILRVDFSIRFYVK